MHSQQPTKNGRERHVSEVPGESTSVEAPELGRAVSLKDLLRIIGRWSWVIVLVAALLTLAVLGYSRVQTPRYEASAVVLIGQNSGLIQNPGDAAGLKEITNTMATAVNSRPVVEAALQQPNLPPSYQDAYANLKAEQDGETQFINVTYTDSSPQNAKQYADAVAEAFSEQVANLQGKAAAVAADAAYQQARGAEVVPMVPPTPTVTATVWEWAEAPVDPVSPNPLRDGLLALALGLMLGLGLAFLLEHLTMADKWRSLDEVEQVSGVPILGVISKK